jgi:hypothetical protein
MYLFFLHSNVGIKRIFMKDSIAEINPSQPSRAALPGWFAVNHHKIEPDPENV